MTAVAGKLRAIEEAPITAGFLAEHDRLELLDAVPDRQEPRDMLLDELQRRHHMGDALTGEVLKIAGLENLHHAILDVMGEPPVVAALDRCRERVGGLVDRFAACRIDWVACS